ncbi:uncharacterized protein LOC121258725 [Juglans microcarpa x Juglans regia]|uniref:uncharacterized protein LOC121258725 n=1 Tax=Juglans microcarpa x Juglans regia TaxID=2249226 RepID=UPI001B7F39C6|nr:uncharacterized protein LOC121258725 [Juglans microcarpa x Juglans regia]
MTIRAGRVIRNANGGLISAFVINLGHGTNNQAEGMGLLHSLRIVANLDLVHVDLELDSIIVLQWIKNLRCGLWYFEDYWEEITTILAGLNFNISHIYRQGNSPADFLARIGANGYSCIWNKFSDLPFLLKGLLKIDKLGQPYLKIKN